MKGNLQTSSLRCATSGGIAVFLLTSFLQAAETPPPILWQQGFGGTGSDNCRSVMPTSDGGFLLGGDSSSDVSGNKTSANYGGADFWLVRVDADGTKLWDRSFGGSGSESLGRGLVPTADGGVLMGGTTTSGISGNKTSPGLGGDDYWLVKVDANGNKLLDRTLGGSADDVLSAVISTSDGGFLLAGVSRSGVSGDKTQPTHGDYDLWVVKVDAFGTQLWDRSFGGLAREGDDTFSPLSIVATEDGGFLIGLPSASGISGNKTSAGQGGFDFWLIKIKADGMKDWERSFGGSGDDVLNGIVPMPDGGFMLGGYSRSGVSGDKTSPGYGLRDYWLVKVDVDGEKLWDKTLGASGEDYLASMVPSGDGGLLLGGWRGCYPLCGDSDYWLVKVDGGGNQLWQQSFGGNAYDSLSIVAPATDGGFLLGGQSDSGISRNKTTPNYGGPDFWMVKLFGLPPCDDCPPRFTIQPTNQLVPPGTGVTLSASVLSSVPAHYQWRFEGIDILNATNATYSLANVSLANGHGNFSVVVSNQFGSVTSSNALIFVNIRPGIIQQPVMQTVLEGQNATFTCIATGAPPIYYRWAAVGYPPRTNTTGILVLTNVMASITNGIACQAFNAAGNRLSSTASLFMIPDHDRDLMADSWEARHQFDTNNAADALLDSDGDGMSNRNEYIAGTDPTDARSTLRLTILQSNGVWLRFTAQSNVAYGLEFEAGLDASTWQSLTNVGASDVTISREIHDPRQPAEGRRLYRLVIPPRP